MVWRVLGVLFVCTTVATIVYTGWIVQQLHTARHCIELAQQNAAGSDPACQRIGITQPGE